MKISKSELDTFIKWNSLSMGSQKVANIKVWNTLTNQVQEQLYIFWKEKEKENLIFHITKNIVDEEKKQKEKSLLLEKDVSELRTIRLNQFKNEVKQNTKDSITAKLLSKNPDRRAATELAVQYVLDWEKVYTTRSKNAKEMWLYIDGIYVPEGQTYIEQLCRYFFGESYTTTIKNEVLIKIEAETYINEDVFFRSQEDNPYEVPVLNGVLNIKTRELTGFTNEKIFFNKINAYYDSDADCPAIKSFVNEITAKKEDVTIIQELFGFVLCKEYFIEKAFMFYGKNGRNGKSKLLQILTTFIGIDNTSSIGLQEIEEDDFAVANLFGKMVNISADISNSAMQHTGNFKKLTGRDVVSANRKFKNYLKFTNYAKMIFASNELPIVYTVSEAFWLRWVIIEFPYQFLPSKEINALQGDDRLNARIQDPDIVKNLLTQDELNGLLNWCLDGLDRLFENRDFSNNETAAQVRSNWIRRSSSVRAFCEDMLVEDYDGYVTKADFQRRYSSYCREHKLKVQNSRAIKNILMGEYGVTESRPVLSDGERAFVWSGVSWHKPKPVITKDDDQSLLNSEFVGDKEFNSVFDAVSKGYKTFDDLELCGFAKSTVLKAVAAGDVAEVKPGILEVVR